jgi:hypothetical protein
MTTKSPSVGANERIERGNTGVAKASHPMRPMSERSRVANREWYPGLCTTCVNALVCTFPRSVDRPVMQCDEFEGAVDVKPRPAAEASRVVSGVVHDLREARDVHVSQAGRRGIQLRGI